MEDLDVKVPEEGADLFEFSENVAITALNFLCVLIVRADKGMQDIGEQRMKGMCVVRCVWHYGAQAV